MARCATSKLVNSSGSPSLQTDMGYCLQGGGTISMGCQEEHFGTAALTVGCLGEEAKAGNRKDQGGLGAKKCGKTEIRG